MLAGRTMLFTATVLPRHSPAHTHHAISVRGRAHTPGAGGRGVGGSALRCGGARVPSLRGGACVAA
jgi:hypothetical protein